MTEVSDFFAKLGPQVSGYASPGLAMALFALAFFLAIHSLTNIFRPVASPAAEKQKPAPGILRLRAWRVKLTPRRVEWKRPIEAIEAWADQNLVDQKNEEFERWIGLCHDWEVTQGKLGKMADESRPLLRQSEAYGRLKEQSHQRLRQIWDDLRLDMERKLMKGELTARGAPASASSDADEAAIKRREWRKLRLDAKGERALEKNADPGSIRYEALMIGNKKK